MDWWTFGVDALASVATLAAVIVAIVLGFYEVRKFRNEQAAREAERRERDDRLKRAQAEQVAGWLRYTPRSEYAEQQGFYVYADIVNASQSPIYDVLVHAHSAGPHGVSSSAWSLRVRPVMFICPRRPTDLVGEWARISSFVMRRSVGGNATRTVD